MAIGLITRGDDFGSFQSANRAIIDAHKNGILKNTSVMVPAPAFEHGVPLLKETPGLCLGLHMTLTAEWISPRWGPVSPAAKVPSLVDDKGLFLADPLKIHQRGVVFDELVLEAKAQLARARAAGLKIEYVDEHMGIGWIHPEGKPDQRFWNWMPEWCKKEGLIWHASVQRELPVVDDKSLSVPERLLKRLALVKDPGAYVIALHPTYNDAEMAAVGHPNFPAGSLGKERVADHDLLCDPAFIQALKDKGVVPIKYTEAAAQKF